jgi:hypothetical protein
VEAGEAGGGHKVDESVVPEVRSLFKPVEAFVEAADER